MDSSKANRRDPVALSPPPAKHHWTEVFLPPEMWEYIFTFLPDDLLLRLRLICHDWDAIIAGCQEIARRRTVFIRNEPKIDLRWTPANLPQIVRRMAWTGCAIDTLGEWWVGIGRLLLSVTLEQTVVKGDALVGLLRSTVMLRHLRMTELTVEGPADFDFQLPEVDALDVGAIHFVGVEGPTFLDRIDKVFPLLHQLTMRVSGREETVLDSVRALAGTLNGVNLYGGQSRIVLRGLCGMERLRLTRVAIDVPEGYFFDVDPAYYELCRKHPLITDLTIATGDCMVLDKTADALPDLRRLTLTFCVPKMCMTFLDRMNLSYLDLRSNGVGTPIFKDITCHYLTEFHGCHLRTKDLLQFLQRCKQLRRITIRESHVSEYETLKKSEQFSHLTYLRLEKTLISPPVLHSLIDSSDHLEEVHLVAVKYFWDDTVEVICKRCQKLRRLTILGHPGPTDLSGSYVWNHCHVLQDIVINLSPEMMDKLNATRGICARRSP